jgi:hypothetical protein
MSQEQEDLIIAMIAQAEEAQILASKLLAQAQSLQSQGEKTQNLVNEFLATVPASVRRGAQIGTQEILQTATKTALENIKTSTEGLQAVVAEGRGNVKILQRTWLLMGVVMPAIAVLIIGLLYFVVMPVFIRGYAEDLADIKTQVKAERAALVRLQSETWRLELIDYQDGTRGIILPKGVKVERTGALQDGSGRVGILLAP